MLQVANIAKSYGGNTVLHGVSFIVNPGERVGLVGPNGCGKTTLLKIIVGQETPDAGTVRLSPGVRIGYLAQGLEYAPDATVGQVMWEALGEVDALRRRLQAMGTAMAAAQGDELARLLAEYGEAQTRYEALGGYEVSHRMDAILDGLGLRDIARGTPVSTLSGGQKTRLGLARLLLADPQLLLLDEPTNHLDIAALEWLEAFLSRYAGAVVIVSHDRTFLDNTVSAILSLDPKTHTVTAYPGNYSDYAARQEREREEQWATYKDQQERIARLEEATRELKGRAIRTEHETQHFYWRKRAKKVARHAIVQQRRIERLLEAEDHVEKPQPIWTMKLPFAELPPSGQNVLTLEGLTKRYGARTLFADVNLVLQQGERVALIGPNGAGKTTLLKIIAGELTPTVGQALLGANVRLGHYSQEQENLPPDSTPLAEIRSVAFFTETEARSFLHYFLFAGEDVFVPVSSLSYGERARLALAKLVAGGCNLLLLDEPINHLDIPSRENFERAMSQYAGTVLVIVHDRYFIRRFATAIWALTPPEIVRYADLDDALRHKAARQSME